MPEPRTLVLIPAYNEEASLPGVLVELADRLPDYDVVVVSDGSTDRTAELAFAGGAKVVELPTNQGVGGALRAGFRFALENGFDRAVQVDADGQHDPDEVRHLIAVLDEGADLVVGSRFAPGGAVTYPVSRARRAAMRALELVVRRITRRRFTDTTSGFRAFSRPLLEHFADTYPVDFMADTVEALVDACLRGFRVEEVAVNMRGRTGGTPSHQQWQLLRAYMRTISVLVRRHLVPPWGERRAR